MSCTTNSTKMPVGPTGGQNGLNGAKGDKGDTGATGPSGASSYTYIAYASDNIGTGFTTTFNSSLDYIGIITSTVPLTPLVTDFVGKWKNYKGATGSTGSTGATGATGPAGAVKAQVLYNNTTGYGLTNVSTTTTYTAGSSQLVSNGDMIEVEITGASTPDGVNNRNFYVSINGTSIDINTSTGSIPYYVNFNNTTTHSIILRISRTGTNSIRYSFYDKSFINTGLVDEIFGVVSTTVATSFASDLVVAVTTTPNGAATMSLYTFNVTLFKQ